MIEIAAIWILVSRIGDTLEAKGRKGGLYKLLAVVLWFFGEFVGANIGGVIVRSHSNDQKRYDFFFLEPAAGDLDSLHLRVCYSRGRRRRRHYLSNRQKSAQFET